MDIDPLRQALMDEMAAEPIPGNIVESANRGDCITCKNLYCKEKLSPLGKSDVPQGLIDILVMLACEPDRRFDA